MSGAKGGRACGGGKAFVKCTKSCLYVCCKKKKKREKKESHKSLNS